MTLGQCRSLLLPLALIALGFALLCGCVFIPASDRTIRGRDVSRFVGQDRSRPIRLHVATRDDVLRVLGRPNRSSPDDTRFAYEWTVLNGTWVYPLCFTGFDQEGARTLLLTFDDTGVLRTAELLKANGNWLSGNSPTGIRLLPADMPASRPSTVPVRAPATLPAGGKP